MKRRLATRGWLLAAAAAVFVLAARRPPSPSALAQKGLSAYSLRALSVLEDEDSLESSCNPFAGEGLLLPTGAPASLSCEAARTIVTQVRSNMAADVASVDASLFVERMADYFDPHALWALPSDAPPGTLLLREREALLVELEAAVNGGPCLVSERVGSAVSSWTKVLRARYDEGYAEGLRAEGGPKTAAEVWRTVSSCPFEVDVEEVTRAGRDLAYELGREVGIARQFYGNSLDPYVKAASTRYFPELGDSGWARALLAGAVRGYVESRDAHGSWAPLEEEISIYNLELEASPPPRLWLESTPTALGPRIDKGALYPLLDGDIVLSVRDVPITGMSKAQVQQSAVMSDSPEGASTPVVVLRPNETKLLSLMVVPPSPSALNAPSDAASLTMDIVRYGDARVAAIAIPDVPDDLGERIGAAISQAREVGEVRGILLDLRANAGGSTEAAISALGHFLPKAALFPMRRRDGSVEVDRAPDFPPEQRWVGPLAVLVDGDTASAAEMIAGAIGSYRRGVVIGDKTYGKGCAQEYLDDDARAGVLRLTTLLFCLPDGAPVQKVGISPQITLSLPSAEGREAKVSRALSPWRGPDVRDRSLIGDVPWNGHGGRVGPCKDENVCRALRALGTSVAAAR